MIKRKNVPFALLLLSGSLCANAVTIKNPGFEDGLTDWTIIDPAKASNQGNSGERSLKLQGSPARVHQWVTVEKNTDYILTAFVGGTGKIGVNNGFDVVKKVVFDAGNRWTKVKLAFNSKSRTQIQVYTKFDAIDSKGYFDDIKIVKAPVAEAPTPVEPTPTEPTPTPVEPTPPVAQCSVTQLDVTASDDGSSSSDYKPAKAVDGFTNDSSRWSSKGDGKWIQLDLGGETTLERLDTAWLSANKRTAYFDVETSIDGSNWISVVSGAESQGDEDLNSDQLNGVYARFVRIIGHGNSSSDDSGWNSLLEAQLFGCNELNESPYEAPTPVAPTPTPEEPTKPEEPTETETPSSLKVPSIITDGSIFDLEGSDPLVNASTLVFLPLEEQVTTPNGNGWRHEYKIQEDLRIAMTRTYEEFQATIKVDLSTGGKTIVAQHHAGDVGTIMKLYVSDTNESGFKDSKASNGIFDVYVRILNTSGKEEKKALGTIKSGDSFTFKVVNNYGLVKVSAFGNNLETEVEDDSESYFKFGNYLQSQYPDGNKNCGTHGKSSTFEKCFKDIGITKSKITMTEVTYIRKTK